MRAEELRIGNYVDLELTDGIESVEVTSISCERILFRYNKNQERNEDTVFKAIYCNIRPIPLTEDWLLKFGFKRFTGWDDMEYFVFGNVHIYTNLKGYEFEDFYIKYVHQLQNLYHALTGEELNHNDI